GGGGRWIRRGLGRSCSPCLASLSGEHRRRSLNRNVCIGPARLPPGRYGPDNLSRCQMRASARVGAALRPQVLLITSVPAIRSYWMPVTTAGSGGPILTPGVDRARPGTKFEI